MLYPSSVTFHSACRVVYPIASGGYHLLLPRFVFLEDVAIGVCMTDEGQAVFAAPRRSARRGRGGGGGGRPSRTSIYAGGVGSGGVYGVK